MVSAISLCAQYLRDGVVALSSTPAHLWYLSVTTQRFLHSLPHDSLHDILMSLLTIPLLPVEQALDHTASPRSPSSDALTFSPDALSIARMASEPPVDAAMDAIYAAFYSVGLTSVPSDFDTSTFSLETRLSVTTPGADGTYLLPRDHLMHHTPNIVDGRELRVWASQPFPTTPFGMGLSFETSGWRAPAWRSPESRAVEAGCINPALLMNEPAPPPAEMEGLSPCFEVPHALAVDAEDDVSEDEEEEDDDEQSEAAIDSDYAEAPKRARAVRPLPLRVVSQSPMPPSAPRTSRSSAPVSSSCAFASSSCPLPKKRKAKGSAGRRATKKAAVTRPASGALTNNSFTLPTIPGVNDDPDLPPPPNSDGVPPAYWPLLRLGCTIVDRGMVCNIKGCTRQTKNFGDMGRHVPAVHYRRAVEFHCDGCPRTFTRRDAHIRHVSRRPASHWTPARKGLLKTFKMTPSVIRMREDCPEEKLAYEKLNTELADMFENLVETSMVEA
ncbi:hypothetical protein B0H19DRAFT_78934 [Mycena capillaripes]|nr:hypothetical protein B0H19DRAFT_78934 [Mycena capillaripes]